MLGWIKYIVVGEYENHVNQKIQEIIDSKRQPISEVISPNFPWSQANT